MWTMDNTSGFSQSELDSINAVIERVMQIAGSDFEQEWLDAAITGEWRKGISEHELYAAVTKRLGLVR